MKRLWLMTQVAASFLLAAFVVGAQERAAPVAQRPPALSQPEQPAPAGWNREQAARASQAAIGRAVGDYRFVSADGSSLSLASLRGRPVVISMIYTACPGVCPVITQQLRQLTAVADEALGPDRYTVLTVGFDAANDTPDRMRAFAAQQRIDRRGWYAVSADAGTVTALANDLGFQFRPSAAGFDHLAQTTILDSEGVVYRQVYGDTFDIPVFVEPLKELTFGRRVNAVSVDGWVNGIKLFCTVYDAKSGRYRFDLGPFLNVGLGAITLTFVGILLWRSWRQMRRERARNR
jgi:protein SCO1/2